VKASVEVMRSYDYCQFRVGLEEELAGDGSTYDEQVRALQVSAARLVDEAVERYKQDRKMERRCRNCGNEFVAEDAAQQFCSEACRDAWHADVGACEEA